MRWCRCAQLSAECDQGVLISSLGEPNFNELLFMLHVTYVIGEEFGVQQACILFKDVTGLAVEPRFGEANREATITFDEWVLFFVRLADTLFDEADDVDRANHIFSYLYVQTRLALTNQTEIGE